jgi:hypothetical protein
VWHTKDVQRFCALLLLTLSALLLVAPLAPAAAEQNLLPACCRRLGAHQCASAMQAASDRQHASFRSVGCLLMPHRSVAVLQKLAGLLAFAGFAFLACWSPFFSTGALESYARALALRSSRGPPAFLLA